MMAAEDRRRIFRNLESFSRVQFALLKLGPLCNATKSRSFTEADCDFERIKDGDLPIAANFSLIFQSGLSFLKDIRDGKKQNLSSHEKSALRKLDEYVKVLDHHEKCLKKVLMRQQPSGKEAKFMSPSKTEVTVAVAEHLLGRLSPGDSLINEKVKVKEPCQCGCNQKPTYSSTGIGHENVWHGCIDMVFSSHVGIPECIATTRVPQISSSSSDAIWDPDPPMKRPRIKDEESNESFPGGKTISEVQPTAGAEDQAIAQIIVFSLLRKQRHPEFHHHLIPNIVISPTDFHIFMYDAVNDVLLGSYPLQIFDVETESLIIESVMILWMVLHYRMFCEGIKVDALTDDFKNIDIKSRFRKIADTKWDVYSTSLRENVSYFPPGKKRTQLTFEGNWFAKVLTYKDTDN